MQDDLSMLLLCRAEYALKVSRLTAWLYACPEGASLTYVIILEREGQSACARVGDDPVLARKLFFDMITYGVDVCHLNDVVGDALCELV